jgi:hypothetical protein
MPPLIERDMHGDPVFQPLIGDQQQNDNYRI